MNIKMWRHVLAIQFHKRQNFLEFAFSDIGLVMLNLRRNMIFDYPEPNFFKLLKLTFDFFPEKLVSMTELLLRNSLIAIHYIFFLTFFY